MFSIIELAKSGIIEVSKVGTIEEAFDMYKKWLDYQPSNKYDIWDDVEQKWLIGAKS